MTISKGQENQKGENETIASQNETHKKHISIQITLKDFATLAKKAEQEHKSIDALIQQSIKKLLQ